MDRKAIIVLVSCFALLLLWSSVIVPKLYPPSKRVLVVQTNAPAETGSATMPTNVVATTPAAALPPPAGAQLVINSNVPEELLVLSNKSSRYTFTSYGGGLKKVELLDYPETVASWQEKHPVTNEVATLNQGAPAPSFSILGGDSVQGDGIFRLRQTETGVRAEKTLTNGLTLIKDFSMGSNYLLNASVRLENRSSNTVSVPAQEWVIGAATPMGPDDKGLLLGFMWFNGEKAVDVTGASFFSSSGFACVPKVAATEYRQGQTNVFWAAVHNQFFALILMPQESAMEIVARRVFLPRPSATEGGLGFSNAPPLNAAPPVGYEASLVYPALTLSPGDAVPHTFVLYAGPKEYQTLAQIAGRFKNHVDAVMGFGTIWGFFSKALLLGMNTIHEILGISYGWTIVVITVLIKLIFWPLTTASTRSMKRMQSLQPQIAAIKEKHKDDPMKVQKKTMELFKANKVNPMGGCLPMLIQMPVFIGFFTMIRSAIELRGASFLWIKDLAKPDTLFVISGVPVIGRLPFNLLPLIMGGTMLWQSHLTPASPSVDPAQQKMMRYMPLLFLVFLYNYSAGMALYWTVNNLLTILQTKMTRAQQAATPAPVLTSPPKKKNR
jgi:YidC/Oxa1 family membrane protein insertase